MKYTITEKRLNKVIFKYLDMEFAGLEKTKGKSADIVFKHPNQKYGILGWEKPGFLGIYYKTIENISYLFGLESTDSKKIIGEWVKNRYKLKVTNIVSVNTPSWILD